MLDIPPILPEIEEEPFPAWQPRLSGATAHTARGEFMRRVWAILTTASLMAAWGCGNSYDIRMNKTLEDMRYRKRLDDNLMPAPTKGKFEDLMIFVRPPKNLQPAKEFLLPLPEPGKFDLEASFLETKAGDASAPGAPTEGAAEQKTAGETQKQS